jgi:MFS family permease
MCGGSCIHFTPTRLLVLFTAINFLNFLDRGVIPGAPTKFSLFISKSLGVESSEQSKYFGLLQSSFIVGFAIAAVICGHLVHSIPPFTLVGAGLLTWCIAIGICAAAEPLDSFWLLIVGRVVSGIGEASFMVVVPPFIE